MAVKTICEECEAEFTAQRSTRRYCSETCRQRAKRARERAARWKHLAPEARCRSCYGLLFPDRSESENNHLAGVALTHERMSHIRKYCSPECRNAARRYRYRVGQANEDSPYRVTNPASDPYALTEPTPCWRSADWHELARLVLTVMEKGWVLMPPPDQGHLGVIDLTLVRDFMVSQRSDPSPGTNRADRELSPREQQDSASPDTASDSGQVQAAPPADPGVQTARRTLDHSVKADVSYPWDDLWELPQ